MDIPTDNRFEILDVEGADAADDMETPVGTPDESGSSVTITDKADTSDGSTSVVETETTITPPSEKPEGSVDRAEPNLNSTSHDKPSNASHPQANVQDLNTRDIPNDNLSQQKAPAAVDMMIITSSIGKALEAKRIYKHKRVMIKHLSNGRDLQDAKTTIEKTKVKANSVVYIVGSNDLAKTKSVSSCMV